MVKLKDVVQELVEKTESGELEWSVDNEHHSWHITRQGHSFIVSLGIVTPRLVILYKPKGGTGYPGQFDGDDIVPLTECLTTKFPFELPVCITASDVLAAALACLTDG